jgi:hypothetical protein
MAFTPRRLMRGASGAGGYKISRSLRFNAVDTAYLVRAPSTTTNRRTFTWSAWVKRSEITPYQSIFSANDNTFATAFGGDQQWQVYFDVGTYAVNAAAVFRDPSAWYHLVVAIDTTQATAANRVKMYANGTQITTFATSPTYPPQNFDTAVNQASSNHRIGAGPTYAGNFFGGYQTDVYLIDGLQLTPSSFGETDAQTGVWKPKAYSGSYGTNGFFVNFSDNSGVTATTLGKDYSGNGNNFTPTNLSVTAGVGNDSFVDSPTLYGGDSGAGGEVRGNYCTWNPISNGLGGTVSNGNLTLSGVSGVITRINSTIGVSSGKWYFESTLTTSGSYTTVGIGQNNLTTSYPGQDALSYAQTLEEAQSINNNVQPSYGTSFASGDVFICAFDLDNNKLFFGKNGTWFGSSNPVTGANPAYTLTAGIYNIISRPNPSGYSSTAVVNLNCGQRPFAYTAPSGFKALCTQNLPTPTIGATAATQAGKYFNTVLYTGTGSARSITGVGFQPDWVWVKSRSLGGGYNVLFDTVRGANKRLITSLTIAEDTGDGYGVVSAFDSDGFSLDSGGQNVNQSSVTYVAWNWNAGGSTVSNTTGSISSQVRANPTSGFSIVTFTATADSGSIGHGLGVVPSMIIIKSRNNTSNWVVYHVSIGAGKYLNLNNTDAAVSNANTWQNTTPTSTVFYSNGPFVTGYTEVAYCFAPIAGYSAFGSYTGNGSADGPFVFTGMRPAYVMVKRTDTTDQWTVYDSTRNSSNLTTRILYSNLANAEDVGTDGIDMLSNGIKMRNTYSNLNASGGTYIYMAFASNPFKHSLAR